MVEDDPLIPLDLKATLEHAGVVVLRPAGRLNDAMLLAEKSLPVAAVLDVRLEVGTSLPLAEWLAESVSVSNERSDPHRCNTFCRPRAAQAVPARAADRGARRSSGQGTVNG